MKILVTGATGLIGSALVTNLEQSQYTVYRLTRSQPSSDRDIQWNPEKKEIDIDALQDFEAIIHLAGESVASGRWTAKKKQAILQSRVQGTEFLIQALTQYQKPPKHFLSASAIGYYGNCDDTTLNESSPLGKGFLSEVCKEWEQAAASLSSNGCRVVHMRFGVIFSMEGGALKKLAGPFSRGIGAQIGNGKQFISWISIQDTISAILHLLETPSISGAINMVSPTPVSNSEMTKALCNAFSTSAAVPIPAFAARLAFGEMADVVLLTSHRVYPEKLLGSGFQFEHSTLEEAFQSLIPGKP